VGTFLFLGKVKENVMVRSIVLVVLLAFSASAGAQALSYNYIQGSYGRVDLDDSSFSADGEGLGVSGSIAISGDFHITGEYQTADMDFGVDLSILEVTLGYHTTISENLDLVAQIGYLDIDVDAAGAGSADDDALLIGAGVRAAVADNVEFSGGIDYIDFDRGDGEMRANAGFVVGLTDELAVGFKATFWDDVNIYQLNLRYYFE
jgi:opacity protein-like surface antigen